MASGDRSGEGDLEGRERGDAAEFWSDIGLDPDSMSPEGQMVAGLVVGGAVLAGLALVFVLVPWLWWLIFIFGWIVFPAVGMFARGVAGLADSRTRRSPENGRERELLEALRSQGELSPAQAAMETSLTVSEADGMLKELSEGGHLQVRVKGGGLFYSLWELGPGEREYREASRP